MDSSTFSGVAESLAKEGEGCGSSSGEGVASASVLVATDSPLSPSIFFLPRRIRADEVVYLANNCIDGAGPGVVHSPEQGDLEIHSFGEAALDGTFPCFEGVEDAQKRFDFEGGAEFAAGASAANGFEECFADEAGKIGQDAGKVFAFAAEAISAGDECLVVAFGECPAQLG